MYAAVSAVIAVTKPWHYWIGVAILAGAIPLVLATVAGYLFKVTRMRYPTKRR